MAENNKTSDEIIAGVIASARASSDACVKILNGGLAQNESKFSITEEFARCIRDIMVAQTQIIDNLLTENQMLMSAADKYMSVRRDNETINRNRGLDGGE